MKNSNHNTSSVVRNPNEISDSRKVARVVKSPSTSSGSLTNRAARSFERPQRYYVLSFILLIFGIFLLTSPALALDPLVPACGRTDAEKLCTTCDFLVVAKNISDFILFYLVPALSALFFIWAGFLILLGGGLTAQVAKGQNIFRTTVYGLLIIFLSWMIVNTVIRTVARDENIAENWWKLECRETVGGALVPTDKARVPSNEDLSRGQPLAQDLLNLGIIFDANADCGGNFHARGNIQSIAAGNFPAVCSRDCKTKTPACLAGGQNGNISVNSRILEGLKGLHPNLKNKHGASFIVTSFTTGIHSPNSTHYTGEAVDIVVNSDDPAVWREARSFLRGFGGTPICERKSDSQDEPNCNLNLINHIHWTLRK